ncbi:DNA-binding protein [Bosea sp. Root483D1]|uniref:type II toxin-antitoxin system VapC family toxin n=1 Tax=Bosea sp. Root483D1 TaxID=1736544 RepID=UPI0007105AAD|nr:PIN domain-containing protein [Bosea sp. Root483D1]KRE14726.1 DNA-binding protein [Bosea sp. Root483D1]
MIVVDSSAWIGLLRGDRSPPVVRLRELEETQNVLVGDIVLLEILRGAGSDQQALAIETRLRQFVVARMLSSALAREGAAHYRDLQARGITIRKTPDLIIATYCIANRHRLLHQDRDFDPFAEHCGLLIA